MQGMAHTKVNTMKNMWSNQIFDDKFFGPSLLSDLKMRNAYVSKMKKYFWMIVKISLERCETKLRKPVRSYQGLGHPSPISPFWRSTLDVARPVPVLINLQSVKTSVFFNLASWWRAPTFFLKLVPEFSL